MLSGRAIALQGVGYSPKLVAVQGFADTEVVVYQSPGTFAPWLPSWLLPRPEVRLPSKRLGRMVSVSRVQSIAGTTARVRLAVQLQSVVAVQGVESPSAAWWYVAQQQSITRGRVIQNPQGSNNVTRMEEEALLVMLAEDDDEY